MPRVGCVATAQAEPDEGIYLDVIETNDPSQAGRGFAAISAEIQDEATDEAEKLPSKLHRYEVAKRKSLETAAFLSTKGEAKLQAAISGCGTYLAWRHYYTLGKLRLNRANFCKKHLLCVLCAIRRGAKHLRAYHERYLWILENEEPLRLQMVTITVKNGPDLGERLAHLKGIMTMLRKQNHRKDGNRKKYEWGKVRGSVTNIEVTEKGNGWHPHTHSIVLSADGIDQQKLSQEVHDISGDSFIVDVRDLNLHGDSAKDFSEVFKYSVCFGELTHDQLYHAFSVLKGKHLISSQGLFRGIPDPDNLTDDPIKDAPYVEFIYKFFESQGYHLEFYSMTGHNTRTTGAAHAEPGVSGHGGEI